MYLFLFTRNDINEILSSGQCKLSLCAVIFEIFFIKNKCYYIMQCTTIALSCLVDTQTHTHTSYIFNFNNIFYFLQLLYKKILYVLIKKKTYVHTYKQKY